MYVLLENLRFGYAVLPARLLKNTETTLSSVVDYFNLDKQEKFKNFTGVSGEGYQCVDRKEYFSIRGKNIPEQLLPCLTYIDEMHHIARLCLMDIGEQLAIDEHHFLDLVPQYFLAPNPHLSSYLRVFYYEGCGEQKIEAPACNIHQDLGLLTLVLRSRTPALEIYDFKEQEDWRSVEAEASLFDIIVMVGETLSYLTNGCFLPATHRVKTTSEDRYSIVYHLYADANAILDSKQFISPYIEPSKHTFYLSAHEFIQKEIACRTSVNGNY